MGSECEWLCAFPARCNHTFQSQVQEAMGPEYFMFCADCCNENTFSDGRATTARFLKAFWAPCDRRL